MNNEERVIFEADGLQLEGLFSPGEKPAGIVVSHPHSLYGGDMYNHVVKIVSDLFHGQGYHTLRYNFRGVGRSQGAFDDGIGEQNDVAAAIALLKSKNLEKVILAGYSFGAWVNGLFCQSHGFDGDLIMVSPPVGFIDFNDIANLSKLKLVISGENDDIAPPAKIEKLLPTWNPAAEFVVIKGGDHFYGHTHAELIEALGRYF